MPKSMLRQVFVIAVAAVVSFGGCFRRTVDKEPERQGAVTRKGAPLTLVGREISVGQAAPDFEVEANDGSAVRFSSFRGKVCVVCSVPSLDTPVCDAMTHRFNEEATAMGEDVVVLTISMDLPFAQKRWCGAAGVENVQTLSDHREASFGKAYGVLIKELRLLGRAVFVVDAEGAVRYTEVVKELTDQPNYAAVLDAVGKLSRKP